MNPLLRAIDRWTPGRKARLVEAVRTGALNLEVALKTHGVTVEEFLAWSRSGKRKDVRRRDLGGKPFWFHSAATLAEHREIRLTLVDMFGTEIVITVPAHDVKTIRTALLRALADVPPHPRARQFEFPRAVT